MFNLCSTHLCSSAKCIGKVGLVFLYCGFPLKNDRCFLCVGFWGVWGCVFLFLVDDSVGNLELYGNLFLTVSDSIFWTKILLELPNNAILHTFVKIRCLVSAYSVVLLS